MIRAMFEENVRKTEARGLDWYSGIMDRYCR